MSAFLMFVQLLLTYLASLAQDNIVLKFISESIPKSMYTIRKMINIKQGITEYVVCPKCHRLYNLSDCVTINCSREESKLCDFVKFPLHPHISKRSKCNAILMKKVIVGGKRKLVPRKSFFYHSVIDGLQRLIAKKDFLQKCEHWKKRTMTRGTYADIYDGAIWQEQYQINHSLAAPHYLSLMMNVDWFNPYEETQYSVGAIYLVVQNLPRHERFKLTNIILVGLIPGPKEPPKTINTYLDPLVTDLVKLYHGVEIPNPHSLLGKTKIKAVLNCVICDIPATRKVCGFLGSNATKGCSKCLYEFKTTHFGSKPDFSGFDCDSWVPRTFDMHYNKCIEAKNALTATRRTEIEKAFGGRYTELLRLRYFDLIRHHVVEPMHNIFLGIAKHTTSTWKRCNILKADDFELIQNKVDSMTPPPKIGRIPRKISTQTGFSAITADEWKNWILLYSVYALDGILPSQHFHCWCLFVKACMLICQLVITDEDIQHAHETLLQFFREFQNLYGKECCTPNMHMACHLRDNLRDYGPLAAFWAFSFERYNGTLESIKISWNGPEKQMLKKIVALQSLEIIYLNNDFNAFLYSNSESNFSSVELMSYDTTFLIKHSQYYNCPVHLIDATNKPHYKFLPPTQEKCFSEENVANLRHVYTLLYPHCEIVKFGYFYHENKKVLINGEEYITSKCKSKRSSAVAAYWPGVLGIDELGEAPVRVGILTSIIRHSVIIKEHGADVQKDNALAHVKWLQDHPQRHFLHSSIIISSNCYENDGPINFIPLSRIITRCAIASNVKYKFNLEENCVCINVPLIKKKF